MNSKFNAETKVWEGVKIPYPVPLDMHLSELVLKTLEKSPKRVIQISYDDGSEMTGEELRVKIIRVAQNLRKLGIGDGDVVSVVCNNSMELMAYINGIIQLGAIVNPMSVDHSKDDLLQMFKDTQPKLVLSDAKAYEKIENVLNELGLSSPIYNTYGEIDGALSADELLKPTGEEENYQNTKFNNPTSKILSILPSSGTTGPSKGVCMSQSFFLKFIALATDQEIRSLSFSAIFWGSAFISLILCTVSSETRIVTRRSFTPELFIDMATKHKATHFLMNPPKLTLLLQSPLIKDFDVSNVKMVMSLGGIVSTELRKKVKETFPKSYFMIFYGLTEVSGAMTFPGQPIDDLTVGFVAPNHMIKIVDDNGNPLGIGETGEILIKFAIQDFLGYYNQPEATKESMDSECFIKTGDIGYVNEEGFVYVIDRKKDIFKYCGHHINPSEIENIIQTFDEVEFVSVVGIPNPETYNLPAAVIKLKEGKTLKEADVTKHVAERLPEYKQLHGGVYFIDVIPMTKNDKILKREAKEIATKLYNERKSKSA